MPICAIAVELLLIKKLMQSVARLAASLNYIFRTFIGLASKLETKLPLKYVRSCLKLNKV